MKNGFQIIARLKSTRLKKKLLREVSGRPILAHMIDRLKLATRFDAIIICTSTNPEDDPLNDIAVSEGIHCFRGDEDDVIKRLYDAAVFYDLDYIVSITGDCPFVDPVYSDEIVGAFLRTSADLILASDLPHGVFSWGLNPSALKTILEIKDDRDTEVWGRYFTDTDLFSVYNLPIKNEDHRQPDLRMTLDYEEDLDFFKAIFKHLYQPGEVFSLDDILDLIKEHPEISQINSHCAEAYKKRWARQSDIKLKSRYTVSKAVIIGCGSIGQRHIHNLRNSGITDITAFRTRKGHYKELPAELKVSETGNWDEVISLKPDIAIISNPTSLHLESVDRLIPHVKGLFVEKPLSHSLEGVKVLLDRIKTHKTIAFVGYDMAFHPGIQKIKDLLDTEDLGDPLVYQCQLAHWLPAWHPYEDFKNGYYARRDLGGGAALTLIHEVHLALEMFGAAQSVCGVFPGSKSMPLDVDVRADLMVSHQSGAVSQIHLDYIQRPYHRCGVISCEKGWIRYDLANNNIEVQFMNDPDPYSVWSEQDYNRNEQFMDELQTFVRYVKEGRMRHPHDAWRAAESLAVVDTALSNADSGCQHALPDWVLQLS